MDSQIQSVRGWMFDAALPHWADVGIDRQRGGHVESLSLDGGRPGTENAKRIRVAARQLYVFSHADVLGWSGAAAVADHLYEYLIESCWQGDGVGWPRTLDANSRTVLDPTPDLYDFAFAMFALAWRHKATGDRGAIELAHRSLDVLDARFRHPAGGFEHELPSGSLPRRQNPHMHLTEAAVALSETSGDARFLNLAFELSELFQTRIVRMPSGVLPEFFDGDWTPAPGEEGLRIEPGHQFEWAWILSRIQTLSGRDHSSVVRALVTWAEAHGVDRESEATVMGVRDDGVVVDPTLRVWPNTERIKGWIGLHEVSGECADAAVVQGVGVLLRRFLAAHERAGCWVEAYDGGGRPSYDKVPASTLYHLFLAFSEVLRVENSNALGS